LGYAILLQGHLYKVKSTGPAGPNQVHLFFDEKGSQVTDANLLPQLAAAAWTRENVVISPDARTSSTHVAAVLGTSTAMQHYTAVQDILARAMAEALVGGATGGTSLARGVTNLTVNVAKSQLLTAGNTLITIAARRGLEMSLDAYKQMEAVPLPAADATALNAADLARIKDLYLRARTLELPNEALVAKLMPTSAGQLTAQAWKSALGEAVGPAFSGVDPAGTVTFEELFKLQKSLSSLGETQTALQFYTQNFNLAVNLAAANDRTMASWVVAGLHECK
jgi:hypothetical protein